MMQNNQTFSVARPLATQHEIQNPPERYTIIDSKANRLWSEAIAIGNEGFIEDVHHQLKNLTIVGKTVTCGSKTVLKEPHSPYNTLFGSKKVALNHKNTYYIELTCRN